jgi:hypothetical protein
MSDMHLNTFEEAANELAKELAKTVVAKQKDYGPDNILKCPVGPELGIVVRVYDKLSRLQHLIASGKTPENESLQDTARDIMGYGMVLKMVLDGTFTLPMEDKYLKGLKNETTETGE